MASESFFGVDIFHSTFRFHAGELPLGDWASLITILILYLISIFGLQKWMEDRKKYEMTWVIPLHNFFLSGLSLLMLVGMLYEVFQVFISTKFDIECLLCDPHKKLAVGRQVGWFYIFYLSKFYELLDTVIICLKKRPIIFLHIYHHCITLVLVFVMLHNEVAVQWISMTANCLVHVPMYYYYAMSSMGYEIWWKKYITMLQITQFIIDIAANSIGFAYHFTGHNCSGSLNSWIFGQLVLLSFLVLFMQFFQSTYKKTAGDTKKTT